MLMGSLIADLAREFRAYRITTAFSISNAYARILFLIFRLLIRVPRAGRFHSDEFLQSRLQSALHFR